MPNSAPSFNNGFPNQHPQLRGIERVVRLCRRLGIQKIRLTGGEPLLRHNLEDLVARIAKFPASKTSP